MPFPDAADPRRYVAHPVADLFPLYREDELQKLADDVATHGLREPIVLDPGGRVLDGRNRLAACERVGVEPRFVTDERDPIDVVVSGNVRRRHLTASQRAIAAALAWDLIESGHGGLRHVGQSAPLGSRAARLGQVFGVSEKYVKRARVVVREAPATAQSVKRGRIGLEKAWRRTATGRKTIERQHAARKASRQFAAGAELERRGRARTKRSGDQVPLDGAYPSESSEERERSEWREAIRAGRLAAELIGTLPPYPADLDVSADEVSNLAEALRVVAWWLDALAAVPEP